MATRKSKPKRNQAVETFPETSTDASPTENPETDPVAALVADPEPELAPEPVPAQIEPTVPAAPATPAPPPEPQPVRVELRVFLAASRSKPDQIAGFRYWATRQQLAKRSMAEWRALLDEFNARPVS